MKQPKKLTLNKETLLDLTAQNSGEVKGGGATACCASYYNASCQSARPFHCQGTTYNKKCQP